MNTYFKLLALLLTIGSTAQAQEISISAAQAKAQAFLSTQAVQARRAQGTATPSPTLAYTSKSGGKTCFYVFNAGGDDGFVIVGGDEAAHEILGYSDHGSFDYDTAPENVKWWLGQYTEQIAHAQATAVAPSHQAKSVASRSEIEPMIQTKWSQSAPYNSKIPTYEDKTFVTGCVATGMAQVMYYYKYPTTGIGSHSYTLEKYPGVTFSADFGNTTYRWSRMKLQYSSSDTGTAADAVATLMYHTGVSVDMDYKTSAEGGSAANSTDIGPSLVNYFGYDRSVRMDYRTFFTDDEWEDFVYEELKEGRPLFYSGKTASGGGHLFLCDGYDSANDMFTINWGWNGRYNGSYRLSGTGALQPSGSGEGGAGAGKSYDQKQMIVTRVMPDCGGEETVHFGQKVEVSETLYIMQGEETYDDYIYDRTTGNRKFYLYTSLQNLSCLATMFDYGVKAVEMNSGTTYYATSYTNLEIKKRSYYTSPLGLKFYPYTWEEGTYEIYPVVRKAGGTDDDWVDVDMVPGIVYPTITVINDESSLQNGIYFTSRPYFNNDNNTYEGDLVLHYALKNGTDEACPVRMYYKLTTDQYIWRGWYGYNSLSAGKEVQGEWDLAKSISTLTEELTPGKAYTIEFYTDQDRTIPYNYPSVTFTYRSKLTVDYSIGAAGWGTMILPFNSPKPTRMTVYSCSEVNDRGVLVLTERSTIERNKPYIIGAYDGYSVSFEGPEVIDSSKPSFTEGILVGALTDNVPLVAGTDYLLKNQNGRVAFYRYTGNSSEKATPFHSFLRLSNSIYSLIALPNNYGEEGEGIESIHLDDIPPSGIYSIDGKRQPTFQKGLNLLLLEDGTVQKVYVK